ncbi:MAG: permease [Candidatus Eremiobacteraeota bacterium]|nr:permease [Candidatus Eremiobacteraeota bacterium]MBC5828165.1 permease [Candidatus Eremiobacteraeota bacterium]
MGFVHHVWDALVMAAAMAWQVGWSLVLGFTLSGIIQAVVSKERMRRQLGRSGFREVALATGYGAASSSCSYAAAALSKTLFKKGAGLTPSLAFLFSSTNLVVELGIILYLLMGWQFTVAEWIGGIVLIAIMSLLVKLTYPQKLVEEARAHVESGGGHEHGSDVVAGRTLWDKLRNPATKVLVAQNVAMDWSMLAKDLIGGFLIAGFLTIFVPPHVWKSLFFAGAPALVQVPLNAVAGALIAIFTFVCSIGNVPMAAVLWGTGISFGGVLSFLYADLIVLPLLDVYRTYYGTRMATYIFSIFFVTMIVSAMIMEVVFSALHQIPAPNTHIRETVETFSFNYTFWLNVVAACAVGYFIYLNRSRPMEHEHHHDGHAHTHQDESPR